MMHNIRHEIISENGLRKEIYRYWFDDRIMRLVLDLYLVEEKATKRHGWRVVARWQRTGRPEGTVQNIRREDVPQRDDVRREVLRQFVESITIE